MKWMAWRLPVTLPHCMHSLGAWMVLQSTGLLAFQSPLPGSLSAYTQSAQHSMYFFHFIVTTWILHFFYSGETIFCNVIFSALQIVLHLSYKYSRTVNNAVKKTSRKRKNEWLFLILAKICAVISTLNIVIILVNVHTPKIIWCCWAEYIFAHLTVHVRWCSTHPYTHPYLFLMLFLQVNGTNKFLQIIYL